MSCCVSPKPKDTNLKWYKQIYLTGWKQPFYAIIQTIYQPIKVAYMSEFQLSLIKTSLDTAGSQGTLPPPPDPLYSLICSRYPELLHLLLFISMLLYERDSICHCCSGALTLHGASQTFPFTHFVYTYRVQMKLMWVIHKLSESILKQTWACSPSSLFNHV